MQEWLVRKHDNAILGPYSIDQIRLFINERRLNANDEICPGNGYWFTLFERDEVVKNLGMEPPVLMPGSQEEDTQTDTKVLLESNSMPALDFDAVKDESTSTRVFVPKAQGSTQVPELQHTHAPRKRSFIPRPIVLSDKIERFSLLKFVAFVLGGIAVGVLLSLLQKIL